MRASGLWLLAMLAACGDDAATPSDAAAVDAEIDARGIDAQACFGSLARVCIAPPTLGTIIIAGALDTSIDPRCDVHPQTGGPDLCVIAGGHISIENTVVTGTRALVFIGTGSVTVNGSLDASSKHGGVTGAAASTAPCAAGQAGGDDVGGGGGGAGGSFGTRGADGGAGGTAPATIVPALLRPGCAGGAGGAGTGASAGSGGASGGVIALYSGSQISMIAAGSIYASGAGGGAGTVDGTRGGGGGGGSGGLVVLDAPSIQILGKIVTNGGAGGGGGETAPGAPGEDGTTVMLGAAAAGGAAEDATHGGPGGAGSALSIAPAPGAASTSADGGAGGGGGGGGVVWVHGLFVGGTQVSPPAQIH